MAAIKSQTVARTAGGAPTYTITGVQGNPVQLRQYGSSLKIIEGGAVIILSQANAADLLTAFTAFANTGLLPS
jgi:hypothetical protein